MTIPVYLDDRLTGYWSGEKPTRRELLLRETLFDLPSPSYAPTPGDYSLTRNNVLELHHVIRVDWRQAFFSKRDFQERRDREEVYKMLARLGCGETYEEIEDIYMDGKRFRWKCLLPTHEQHHYLFDLDEYEPC